MSDKEILEGNRIIAEFMGSVRKPDEDLNETEMLYFDGVGKLGGYLINFDYHSSFDWLMPVVEKIESLCYKFEIIGCYTMGRRTIVKVSGVGKKDASIYISNPNDTKIKKVFDACIQFIQWYNQNTKK